jgi:tRNA(Ile)-lysidine synthase
LARRVRRVEAALEVVIDAAAAALAPGLWPPAGPIEFPAARFEALPAEVALRLLGRAVRSVGDEGPVELGKLEVLAAALFAPTVASGGAARFRRTLAGAVVTRAGDRLVVERAPARRSRIAPKRP